MKHFQNSVLIDRDTIAIELTRIAPNAFISLPGTEYLCPTMTVYLTAATGLSMTNNAGRPFSASRPLPPSRLLLCSRARNWLALASPVSERMRGDGENVECKMQNAEIFHSPFLILN